MAHPELVHERSYVALLYRRLDQLRELATARRAERWRQEGGTPQARTERDDATAQYGARLTQLHAAEHGLCFGRLDLEGGVRRYVGRMGLLHDDADHEPLLVDWRAPAARPFYVATAARPESVRRRRHITTRQRVVVELQDELLDPRATDSTEGLTGEAALMAALGARRTGRMSDIVETIQAEQDRVIRSEARGVLVVQGGPGTGKTAVALHRAAYLLYTHRERLAKTVVLVIGPNPTFLRYIGQVLPSLGETGVLLSTIGDLYPGVRAHRTEPTEVAEVKGRLWMADVVAAAVRDRQAAPDDELRVVVDGQTLLLARATCVQTRDRARRSGRTHNRARLIVVDALTDALARQVVVRRGVVPEGGGSGDERAVEGIRRQLLDEPAVQRVLDELWPVLTPERLLDDLFSSSTRLAAAAPDLSDERRALLRRDPAAGWTPADVPLLDEAAELLGEDDGTAGALAAAERRQRTEYAQEVLDAAAGSRSVDAQDEDPEMLTAADLVDADWLAERYAVEDQRTQAEQAAADRTWTFGHVIVDEAQELSEMAWRLLVRRCPTRSMTLVGDVAQTGDVAGTSSWARVLEPYVGDRWRLEELTVNYRMPAEVMAVAADVLAGLDPPLDPPRSVRQTGVEPWSLEVQAPALAERLAAIVAGEAAVVDDGRLAVIVPATRLNELAAAITAAVPTAAVGEDPELTRTVVVLGVAQTKGLEFDAVLVVDPARIVADSPRGHNDLYVALTRATRRLGVVHPGPLPAALDRLRPEV